MSPRRDIGPLLASQTKAFFFFFICSFLWLCFFPSSCTAGDSTEYTACAPKSCNGIPFDYPFSLSSTQGTSCGLPDLNLSCQGNETNSLPFLVTPTGVQFIVKGINYMTQTITLAIKPSLMLVGWCPRPSVSITLSDITNGGRLPLRFSTNYRSVTLFNGCSAEPVPYPRFDPHLKTYIQDYNFTSQLVSGCSVYYNNFSTYAFYDEDIDHQTRYWLRGCQTTLSFPILASSFSSDATDMASYLSDEFDLVWAVDSMGICADCTASGGRCGYNATSGYFLCFCKQESLYGNCNHH